MLLSKFRDCLRPDRFHLICPLYTLQKALDPRVDLKAIVYLDRSEMKDLTDDVVIRLNEAYAKEKERLNKTPTRVK